MSFNLQTIDKSQEKTNKIIFLYSTLHVIVIGHLIKNSFAFALSTSCMSSLSHPTINFLNKPLASVCIMYKCMECQIPISFLPFTT